ncbi:MAG: helix-turn-helix transcriptional regulator [Hyphomicrobiaceae bacterium]
MKSRSDENILRLVRLTQVLKLLGISKSSWYAGIKSGKYPPPIKLGPRTSRWRLRDILALMDNGPEIKKNTERA